MVMTAIVFLTIFIVSINILRVQEKIEMRYEKARADMFFLQLRENGKHRGYIEWDLKVAKTLSVVVLYAAHLIIGTGVLLFSYITLVN